MGIKNSPSSRRTTFATAAIFTIVAVWFSTICLAADPDSPDAANDALANVATSPIPAAGTEKFVPNITPIACSGTLEMLKTAEISGKVIRVRQVVRWSEADSESFSSIADLIIDRYDGQNNRKLTIDEVKSTLSGAGVNLGMVRFSGARTCLISHSDKPEAVAPKDDHEAVQQWMEKTTRPAAEPVAAATPELAAATIKEQGQPKTLRDLLLTDVSQRLNLPVDELQMTFDPKDRTLLNLSEPEFQFDIQPRRVRDLGRVSWDVTVISGDKQHAATVNAEARVWEQQLEVGRSVAYKQVLRDADITEHRVLVDHVREDPLLKRDQAVGQQAARDLKAGTVLTSRLVDPVPLVHNGDYVTVTLNKGSLQIRTVDRAMEAGAFGQTIKVKNEQTQDVFEVTLTGPQEATIGALPAAKINAE